MTRPWHPGRRDPFLCERDLERYRESHPKLFPESDERTGPTRAELRLAAEVALAVLRFEMVPGFARDRATSILTVMAKG